MRIIENFNSKPSIMYITVKTNVPTNLSFVGLDTSKKNTVYFKREKKLSGGEERIEFPMPQSPNNLTIDINTLGGGMGGNFTITKVEIVPLSNIIISLPKNTKDFISFIQSFCEKAGELPEDFYISKNSEFAIWFKPNIDTSGTPAKVNRRTGVIKVSMKDFVKYTIPMRMFILLHEYFHWYYGTEDEFKADSNGLRVYLQLKYPKSEANYAMTKVFTDSKFSRERMAQMNDIIKNAA